MMYNVLRNGQLVAAFLDRSEAISYCQGKQRSGGRVCYLVLPDVVKESAWVVDTLWTDRDPGTTIVFLDHKEADNADAEMWAKSACRYANVRAIEGTERSRIYLDDEGDLVLGNEAVYYGD